MNTLAVIELKRKEWKEKWKIAVELLAEVDKKKNSLEKVCLECRVDVIQEAISDYTYMINTIKELTDYENKCEELINNHLKKTKW
jgi:ATP-dependent Lon protease